MEAEAAERLPDYAPARRRWNLLTWPTLLALGWLLYELTAQPAAGIVAVCFKFGWNDFRAAFWLRRMDGYRPRARACFCLYLASGMWKVAMTATVAMFGYALLPPQFQPAQPQPAVAARVVPAGFPAACLTAFFGFELAAMLMVLAVWIAWRNRIQLWLSSAVHRAQRQNLWPPYDERTLPTNYAGRLLFTGLMVVGAPTIIFALMALVSLAAQVPEIIRTVLVLGVLVGGGGIVLVLKDVLNRRLLAPGPWDCWGTEQAPSV